eukprot:1649330-Alexandrium_andersonii.AAC.1
MSRSTGPTGPSFSHLSKTDQAPIRRCRTCPPEGAAHYGPTVDSQPTGTSYRHAPDIIVVSPVHPGAIYVERH